MEKVFQKTVDNLVNRLNQIEQKNCSENTTSRQSESAPGLSNSPRSLSIATSKHPLRKAFDYINKV
jgi:hypothetical protein